MSHIKSEIKTVTQEEFTQRYEIVDQIDQGTYGIVMKGLDKETGKFVAMKKLIDNYSLETMVGEAKTMKAIKHKNVLNCLDLLYVREKMSYYLITQFCPNGSLRRNIQQIVEKDTAFKIKICLDISKGVQALHAVNIMHRDISPGNILFDESWMAKLCDFGFSKRDNDIEQSINVGTQAFRDPNIKSGKYSKKCDIYSLGMIFDYIFRGEAILSSQNNRGLSFDKLFVQFMNNKKQMINALNCPEKLKEIIQKCLENEERERWNAKDLVARMKELAKDYLLGQEISHDDEIEGLNNIEIETASEKNERLERAMKKFERPDIQIKRMETEREMPSQTFQIDEGDSSLLKSTIFLQQDLTEEIKKETQTLDQQTHLVRLMIAEKQCEERKKNISYMVDVYTYYVRRKNVIKNIDSVTQLKCVNYKHKKIIVFICFFCYLRFLKAHKAFLKNQSVDHQIYSVDGVQRNQMSPQTIELCNQLIDSEIKLCKSVIKQYVDDIYLGKNFLKDIITKNILEMISESREKNFIHILNFDLEVCARELLNLTNSEKFTSDEEEAKQKIKEIANAFL